MLVIPITEMDRTLLLFVFDDEVLERLKQFDPFIIKDVNSLSDLDLSKGLDIAIAYEKSLDVLIEMLKSQKPVKDIIAYLHGKQGRVEEGETEDKVDSDSEIERKKHLNKILSNLSRLSFTSNKIGTA